MADHAPEGFDKEAEEGSVRFRSGPLTCSNCPAEAECRVSYYSDTIEPAEVVLCHQCSFELHQEMYGHLMWLHGQIEERPLEESDDG